MGNFESDEGPAFFLLYTKGSLLIHVHTPFTPSYSISFLLKEINIELMSFVFKDFINCFLFKK